MVGHVYEYVADWSDRAAGCTVWSLSSSIEGDDVSCYGGAGSKDSSRIPGAQHRGGSFLSGVDAGVFAIDGGTPPSFTSNLRGFRCAR